MKNKTILTIFLIITSFVCYGQKLDGEYSLLKLLTQQQVDVMQPEDASKFDEHVGKSYIITPVRMEFYPDESIVTFSNINNARVKSYLTIYRQDSIMIGDDTGFDGYKIIREANFLKLKNDKSLYMLKPNN